MARRPQQPAKKDPRRRARRNGLPLDAVAADTLRLLMHAFIRRGHSIDDIVRHCDSVGRQYQPTVVHEPNMEGVSRDDWIQIINIWSSDPAYVDAEGEPLPLPVEGAAPSLEALHQRVGSKLTLMEACSQMLATGVARKEENRLVAMARAPILFPAGSAEQSDHHLHFLHSALLNIEHNAAPPGGVRWVERLAICQQFPVAALGPYSASAMERAQMFLASESATMHRIATSSTSQDRTVEATVHVFLSSQERPGPAVEARAVSGDAAPSKASQDAGSRKPIS